MVWGDYWVIDLDHGYQLAAVSDSKREYLWVLARNRQVDPTMYSALLGRLTQQGFNVQKLILTKQID
jgi:apolipoprotein D and lipocalin family protein